MSARRQSSNVRRVLEAIEAENAEAERQAEEARAAAVRLAELEDRVRRGDRTPDQQVA